MMYDVHQGVLELASSRALGSEVGWSTSLARPACVYGLEVTMR